MTTVFCSRQAVAEKNINKTAPITTVILTTAGNPVRTNDLSIFSSLDFVINITNRPEISNSIRTRGISLAKPLHSPTDTYQAIRIKRYGPSALSASYTRFCARYDIAMCHLEQKPSPNAENALDRNWEGRNTDEKRLNERSKETLSKKWDENTQLEERD